MAKEPDAPSLQVQVDAIADAISRGIVRGQAETGPIKQIPITKYRTKTPFNKKGLKPTARPQMTRTYIQNGNQIPPWAVTDEDIEALNQLKPGRYVSRKVEVIERLLDNGEPANVEIRYNDSTADHRFELKNYFRSFSELLRLILDEQREGAAVA